MLTVTKQEPDVRGAQSAATRLITEYGIASPDQLVIEDIAWARGVHIRYSDIQGAEGWLVRKGDKGIARISNQIPQRGRQRFAAAHELGHWERHINLSQAWICTSDYIHAYRGSAAEIEASAFAAELLMPASLFRPQLEAGISFRLASSLAEKFQTTLTATSVRMVEETSEDAYVIFSHDGCVRWWRRSQRASLFIPKGFRIRPGSQALMCGSTSESTSSMTKVEMDAWFDDDGLEGLELWEESCYLGEYDTGITLLCIV